jgi:hypothetical protein
MNVLEIILWECDCLCVGVLVSLSQYCSLSTLTKLFVEMLKFSKKKFQKTLLRKIENMLNNGSDKTF